MARYKKKKKNTIQNSAEASSPSSSKQIAEPELNLLAPPAKDVSTAATESKVRMGPQPPTAPVDLGTDEPAQVHLQSYPTRIFNTQKRSFNRCWFNGREWLEYSAVVDAAFCFPCRKFSIGSNANSDKAFTDTGFSNWKSAMESTKGFARHASSKEHLKCSALWKEYCARRAFLVSHQQPLRGTMDSSESREEGGSGLFLSMIKYTLRKENVLAQVFSSIPKNATYTSHEIQNEFHNEIAHE